MTKDVHVFLSDEDAAALTARARREVRSVTNMAHALILSGLRDDRPVMVAPPRRGRPPKPIVDLSDDGLADMVDRERLTPRSVLASMPVLTDFPVRTVQQRKGKP